jgi:Ca2+-binding RTX toxin-like protein
MDGTANLTFNITTTGITVSDGINTVTHAAGAIEHLYAGSGSDRFIFGAGATLAGTVEGRGGNDLLDFSAYTTPVHMTLTGVGPLDGFLGLGGSVMSGFANINAYTGGSGSDTLTGRTATASSPSSRMEIATARSPVIAVLTLVSVENLTAAAQRYLPQ